MNQKNLSEKRKLWEELVEQYKDSGKSQIQFCKDNNVKNHQLSYYAQKFKQKAGKKIKPSFAKVIPETKVIKPTNKAQLDAIDPKWLAVFLKELYARP